ncbi:MAG: 50S ribosome-binding GTPase [Phycisphaerales bacterium]|nr:50S ribosome-binding GTPase [Phycisphaerales bacterium]
MSVSDWHALTSAGPAAIGIIRLRGPAVAEFLARHVLFHSPATLADLRPNLLRRGNVVESSGETIDDCLILVESIAPNWAVQIHHHGSLGVADRIHDLLDAIGFEARQSNPVDSIDGSLWATTALDAEVLSILPYFSTAAGMRWLLRTRAALRTLLERAATATTLDDAREIIGPLIANASLPAKLTTPTRVALVGPPNAGKSTLINALTDRPVSLVADRPGTTRDWVEAPGEAAGFPVMWIDTAGMRTTTNAVEAAGVERARRVAAASGVLVVVVDASLAGRPAAQHFFADYPHLNPQIVILNKIDLADSAPQSPPPVTFSWAAPAIRASAKTGLGMDSIRAYVARQIWPAAVESAAPAPITPRQRRWFEAAAAAPSIAKFHAAITACLEPVT